MTTQPARRLPARAHRLMLGAAILSVAACGSESLPTGPRADAGDGAYIRVPEAECRGDGAGLEQAAIDLSVPIDGCRLFVERWPAQGSFCVCPAGAVTGG